MTRKSRAEVLAASKIVQWEVGNLGSVIMAKALWKAKHGLADLAFRFMNHGLVRPTLGKRYARALALHRPNLPPLSDGDRRIVDDLERRGYHISSLAAFDLAGSGEMLANAQRLATRFADWARAEARNGRDFICVPTDDIAAHPEIFTWGAHERLLNIVECYLGLPVAYDGLQILYTVADGRATATRLWHRDREDRKMVKIAIYLHDINEGDGPLQLISRLDRTQGDEAGYRYAGGSEAELARVLGEDFAKAVVTCGGRAGTVVFMETARYFHRGEPVTANDRRALYYSYFARKTRHPFFCNRSGFKPGQVAQMAQGLSLRQRACIQWRRELPLWLKLIPSAPV